jgi:threonine dehydratase
VTVAIQRPMPAFADIEAAARRLNGYAVRTPLLRSAELDRITGATVLVKAECLQRTGSFKFRGAWNFISQLPEEAKAGGVVAFSSGNHAQGVAAAAQLRGFPAVIVMPEDAPAIKKANTRGFGAEVLTYDRVGQSREEIARRIAAERGAVLVPPYDHPWIIAGQGTTGLEIAADASAQGLTVDDVLVCASGGGLTAGIALALETLSPQTSVYTAEPIAFDDHRRSLASGQREMNEQRAGSICDALLSPQPGELTFSINLPRLRGGVAATDEEVRAAMRFAFDKLKIVVEPGGAVALACLLAGRIDVRGRTAVAVVSGGNVDPAMFAEILTAA